MKYQSIGIIGDAKDERKAVIKTWRNNPGCFDSACYAGKYYAKRDKCKMMIIPGNSYGVKVFHIVPVSGEFAKFKPGCMNGIAGMIGPDTNLVHRVRLWDTGTFLEQNFPD